MRGHWLNASMPRFCWENMIFDPLIFSFTTFSGVLFQFRPNSDKIQTKDLTKFRQTQTKTFRHVWIHKTPVKIGKIENSDKIQTTKSRQNSEKKFRKKIRQNSDKTQTKNQTKFRQSSGNKIQTKFRQKIRQKFRQISDQNSDKDSDKVQTEIRVKFRHKSDRIPGLGIFGCSGSFEKVLSILKMKLQNAFCCFQKALKCSSLFFVEDPLFFEDVLGSILLFL